MEIKGKVMDLNVPNHNGRIYTRECFENAVNEYQKKIDNKQSIGTIDDVNNSVNISNTTHLIEEITINDLDDSVHVKARILDTPLGKQVKNFINSGMKYNFFIVGYGEIENRIVKDYKLESVSISFNPSFRPNGDVLHFNTLRIESNDDVIE